ncbi:MAG: glutathione S-transferase family protein [Kordiimonadaceae bacterium]|nr:glutathione S-transferase family protein [Kordiimonadaceae bacterium]MBO6567280.1 glutathione S-transferase family protein [Kordiimonadaceae bacterium]MBO6963506.1 glutathione S-transferase family protein [Kordiimonadaceae bacterium]
MTLTVCGLIGSPFFRKILTQLNEKGVAYDVENVSPFGADENFTKMSPARRIPLLKDSDHGDDWVLPDSTAIFHYLEKKISEPALVPSDLADYGRALWFEEYADTEMASTIGLGIFRKIVFPQMQKKAPDIDGAMEVIRGKLIGINDYIEQSLEGREWLVGDSFSVADISVAVQYANLSFTGYVPSAERWPNISAFMRRVGERDSFAGPHVKAVGAFANMQKIEIDPAEGL